MIQVIKRDGRMVPFEWSKITDAILKAYCDAREEKEDYPSYCISIAKNIEDVARECDNVLTVEDSKTLLSILNKYTMNKQEFFGGSLNGIVYAVRVYDKVLTTDQIRANYNIDKSRFSITFVSPNATNTEPNACFVKFLVKLIGLNSLFCLPSCLILIS